MLLLRRAAGFAALLPALLACGAPELLARALGCDDANTALANTALGCDANTRGDTASSATAAAASSLCTIASSSSAASTTASAASTASTTTAAAAAAAAAAGASFGGHGLGRGRLAERAHPGEAAARHAAAALHALLALSTSRHLVAQHVRAPLPEPEP